MDPTAPNRAAARSTLNPLAPSWTPGPAVNGILPARIRRIVTPQSNTEILLIASDPRPTANGILPAGGAQPTTLGAIGEAVPLHNPPPTPRLTLTVPFGDQFALVDFIRLQLSDQDPEVTPPAPSLLYTPFRRNDPPGTSAFESDFGENLFENQHWHIQNASAPGRLTNGTVESPEAPEARRRLLEAIREADVALLLRNRYLHTRNTSSELTTDGILESPEAPAPTLLPEANGVAEVAGLFGASRVHEGERTTVTEVGTLTGQGVEVGTITTTTEAERDPVELEIERHPLLNCRQN